MTISIEPRIRFAGSTVGIVGLGVVGNAVRAYFESLQMPVRLFDPYKHLGSVQEVNEADLIFVCVPTPYTPGIGFDARAVDTSLSLLDSGKIVVIKSTVLPGTTERLQAAHPDKLVLFNPEFLREKTANEDFLHPDLQIVGCADRHRQVASALMRLLPRAGYEAIIPAINAELIKYSINSFLALKVIFANELFDLCAALGADYESVKEGLTAEPRIGGSHLEVLHSGYRGYGGKCLPKDVLALLDLADGVSVDLRLLKTAHEVNQRLMAETAIEAEAEERAA